MPSQIPGFWMNETSGVLRPAIEAYYSQSAGTGHMTGEQIAAMRAYLHQWIAAPEWKGPEIEPLRRAIEGLTSYEAIKQWLDDALDANIDPL
jgi:hypothetical protein